MTKRDGPKGRAALDEIEARLGEIFASLKAAFGTTADTPRPPEAGSPGGGSGADPGAGPLRVQSRVRVRMGGLEVATALDTPSSPPPPGGSGPAADGPAARAPRVDTRVEDGEWMLTAELPGVAPEGVAVEIDGRALRLTAQGRERFEAVVEIPAELDPATLAQSVENGVLELRGRITPGAGDAQ